MAKTNDSKRLPANLADAARQFARWRAGRRAGERIPDHLWRLAGTMATQYGVSQTAARLRLDYYRLKRHAGAARQQSAEGRQPTAPRTAFVQLPALLGTSPHCVIEIEEPGGRKLRIELPAAQAIDALGAIGLGEARSA